MREFFTSLTGQTISGIVVAAICALFVWRIRTSKQKTDTAKIIGCLENSDDRFRSTHAIASNTNLTEDRVRILASASVRIRRNEKEKESWALVE